MIPDMEPVDSSRITEYGYDTENATVYVTFHDGLRWQYRNVPEHVWHEFRAAASKGAFVNEVLKSLRPRASLNNRSRRRWPHLAPSAPSGDPPDHPVVSKTRGWGGRCGQCRSGPIVRPVFAKVERTSSLRLRPSAHRAGPARARPCGGT